MSPSHLFHAAHQFLEKTKMGHQTTTAAVAGTVGLAHVMGGTAAAAVAAVAAPIVVPVGLTVGICCLAAKVFGKKH
jgi:hypothetical protein